MSLAFEITDILKNKGTDFIHFIDISKLPVKMNKHFPVAILFGISLSPKYLKKILDTPEFVKKMIQNNEIAQDEFHLKEIKTDGIADSLAVFLQKKGYKAYSQSEKNIIKTGFYNKEENRTPLPHKTIALMAGMGWIGKNNLLVTPEFGSAFCMCSVLTNAPLDTTTRYPMSSKCDNCHTCVDKCKVHALKGKVWDYTVSRDEIVDVSTCTTCIECLVFCPFTQNYMNKNLIETVN